MTYNPRALVGNELDFNMRAIMPNGTLRYSVDFNDTTKILDGSGNPVTNGVAVATQNNYDGSALAAQSTSGNRPVWASSQANGYGGIRFTNKWLDFSVLTLDKNQTMVSYMMAFIPKGAAWRLYSERNNSNVGDRFVTYGTGNVLNTALTAGAGGDTNYNTGVTLVVDTVNVIIVDWDQESATISIAYNGRPSKVINTTLGSQGAIENLNASSAKFGNNACDIVGLYSTFIVGARSTPLQQSQVFAALKARYAATSY